MTEVAKVHIFFTHVEVHVRDSWQKMQLMRFNRDRGNLPGTGKHGGTSGKLNRPEIGKQTCTGCQEHSKQLDNH